MEFNNLFYSPIETSEKLNSIITDITSIQKKSKTLLDSLESSEISLKNRPVYWKSQKILQEYLENFLLQFVDQKYQKIFFDDAINVLYGLESITYDVFYGIKCSGGTSIKNILPMINLQIEIIVDFYNKIPELKTSIANDSSITKSYSLRVEIILTEIPMLILDILSIVVLILDRILEIIPNQLKVIKNTVNVIKNLKPSDLLISFLEIKTPDYFYMNDNIPKLP